MTEQRAPDQMAEARTHADENYAIFTLTGVPRDGFSLQQEIRAQHEELTASLDEAIAIIKAIVDQHGPWCDEDCPGDDTCDCSAKPLHDRINAAIAEAEGR